MNELPREKVKSLKDNIFFFVTIGVIIFLALMFFGMKYLTLKNKEKEDENLPNVTEKEKENEQAPKEPVAKEEVSKIPNLTLINNEEATISITVYKEGEHLCPKREELTCTEAAFTFLVTNANAKIMDINNEFILYIDNILKVYDIGTKKKYKVNLENTFSEYKLVMNNTKIAGIIYYSGLQNNGFKNKYSVSGFYDLGNNKKKFENMYDFFTIISNGNYLVGNKYNAFESNNSINASFLEIATNSTMFSVNSNDFNSIQYEIVDNYIVVSEQDNYSLYSLNGKLITSGVKQGLWTVSKKYLYVVLNNELLKYDLDGDLISRENGSNIYNLIDSYKVVNVDNFLYVKGLDNDYDRKVLEMTDEYIYSRLKSDYTTRNDREAFYLILLSKNEGIVGYEVSFTLTGKKIKKSRLEDNEYYHEYFK